VFTSILVGLDGSESSRRALADAVELARLAGRGKATLTLMTVAPPVAAYAALARINTPREIGEELDRWATEVLDAAAATVPRGVAFDRVQVRGHAGPEIIKELRKGRHDLVVLGSRGRARTQEVLLGSVAGHVHFHSRVPLLIVPG
jgi:nucleotide-binding universal stress UspA family protein